VLDPHLDANARRKEMEDEMDEEEKDGLRGGWEDFVGTCEVEASLERRSLNRATSSTTAGPRKREHGVEPERDPTRKQKKRVTMPSLGSGFGRDESMRGLGLKSTSSGKDGSVLGARSISPIKLEAEDKEEILESEERDIQPLDDGRSGWECRTCTFINLMDHGRCGESAQISRWPTCFVALEMC